MLSAQCCLKFSSSDRHLFHLGMLDRGLLIHLNLISSPLVACMCLRSGLWLGHLLCHHEIAFYGFSSYSVSHDKKKELAVKPTMQLPIGYVQRVSLPKQVAAK